MGHPYISMYLPFLTSALCSHLLRLWIMACCDSVLRMIIILVLKLLSGLLLESLNCSKRVTFCLCYSHRIVIASSAFGLGVDIKDIRQIIFMQPPGATSELVQQIGRGGRDGGTCTCTIHYSNIELGKAKKEMKALIQASCLRVYINKHITSTKLMLSIG